MSSRGLGLRGDVNQFVCSACRHAQASRRALHAQRTVRPSRLPSPRAGTRHASRLSDRERSRLRDTSRAALGPPHPRSHPRATIPAGISRHFSHGSTHAALVEHQSSTDLVPPIQLDQVFDPPDGIRNRLRQWQKENQSAVEAAVYGFAEDDDVEVAVKQKDNPSSDSSPTVLSADPVDSLDLDVDEQIFAKGALVTMPTVHSTAAMIFIRNVKGWGQFIDERGRVQHRRLLNANLRVNDWFDPAVLDKIIPYLPAEEFIDKSKYHEGEILAEQFFNLPKDVVQPVVEALRTFNAEAAEIYRKNASSLDAAHELLAHEEDLRYGSLSSIATHLFQLERGSKPTLAQLYVVMNSILKGAAFTWDAKSFVDTNFVQIRSKRQLREFNEITELVRQWQEETASRIGNPDMEELHGPIPRFLAKVRKMIAATRESRPVAPADLFSGVIPMSTKQMPMTPEHACTSEVVGEKFNAMDKKILSFIECHAVAKIFFHAQSYQTVVISLLKATGMYDEHTDFTPSTAHLFLQEIGVIRPWENPSRRSADLMLPTAGLSRPLEQLADMLEKQDQKPYQFVDSLKHIRHDWGEMRAYAIDGASTYRLDDAVSIEPVAGTTDVWLHVHIANPTAFIARDDPMARLARHLGETLYTPDHATPMLPDNAVMKHWSMGNDRPVMTFSARLDATGEMKEHTIRAGIIRNVVRIDKDTIDRRLRPGQKLQREKVVLQLGPIPEHEKEDTAYTVDERSLADLKLIVEYAQYRAGARERRGGQTFDKVLPSVEVWRKWDHPGFTPESPYRASSRLTEGDVSIRMTTTPWFNPFEGKGFGTIGANVAEAMLLACEVAGQWCADRQIPGLYRGTRTFGNKATHEEYYENVVKPLAKRNGGVAPFSVAIEQVRLSGRTVCTTKPLFHFALGLSHFMKVTSPLRRYGDMVVHWQIQAALLEEARTGQSLITTDANADRSFLAYSRSALATFSVGYMAREAVIRRTVDTSSRYYTAMLLHRLMCLKKGEWPFKKLHAIITLEDMHGGIARASIMEIGIDCFVNYSEDHHVMRLDDIWEVELELINVFRGYIAFKAVRRVSTLEERLDPA